MSTRLGMTMEFSTMKVVAMQKRSNVQKKKNQTSSELLKEMLFY